MSVIFKKAPLIEMIAELRWWGSADAGQPSSNLAVPFQQSGSDLEQFLQRFGQDVAVHNFIRSERMAPFGVSFLPFTPAMRFRRGGGDVSPILFQVGVGYFSAHALPPYHSWKDVRSTVQIGVEALVRSRSATEMDLPFRGTSLRYLNAFGSALVGGRDVESFAREVFGISVGIPEHVSELRTPAAAKTKIQLQFSLPVKEGFTLSVTLGDGAANNEPAIFLDMTIASNEGIEPNPCAVLDRFTESRDIIHRVFLGLVRPIYDSLEPVEEA